VTSTAWTTPMHQKTKGCIEGFIQQLGEEALVEVLSESLKRRTDEYTLTIICNRGVHAIPESTVRGEEFTLSEGRSIDTSSTESMHQSVSAILAPLARKLKEKNWRQIYIVPSGHPLLYAHAKLMVFQITRIETIDSVYVGDGEYIDLYVSHRAIATSA
jgi:hypothetical protein